MRKGIIVLVAAFAAVLSVHAAGGATLSANDEAEIHGLYARYVWAFDSSDGDMFASVFTDDGEFVTERHFRDVSAIPHRKVAVLPPRHLLTINWAGSGPGYSWPVAITSLLASLL